MTSFVRTATGGLILIGIICAAAAEAGTDLVSPQTIQAWADVRAVAAGGERGWLDDGFGKLRYSHESRLDLAQAAVLWMPRFSDSLTAHVLVQDVPDAAHPFGVEEAFVKWKPLPVQTPAGLYRFTVRAGQMFPPVSMEHDGPGWTVSRTLTPSAINSWIGEEVLVSGLEASVATQLGEHMLGVTLGGFSRDDTSGTILSWRGWALHDLSTDGNTELPLPSGAQGYTRLFGARQATQTRPLDEVDHRLGYYARADWRPPARMALNLEYYANQGNPSAVRNGQWGWDTRFWNLGAQCRLSGRDVLLSQYMLGSTATGYRVGGGYRAVDVDFDSVYLLWTHDFDHDRRLSGRIDYFGVKDFSKRAVDDNTDKGYALTLAWTRHLSAHADIALEGLGVTSIHPARTTQGLDPHQAQIQLQAALKLHL